MLRNFTPHTLNIHRADGSVLTLPSEGVVRVEEQRSSEGEVRGIPLTSCTYKGAEFPSLNGGDTIIVSGLAASALATVERPEGVLLTSPGSLVRDEGGRPCGCKGLTLWS